MKRISVLFLILTLGLAACHNSDANGGSERKMPAVVQRDTTIIPSASFSLLQLDSAHLEKFIQTQAVDKITARLMRNFYNNRNYQYAWFTDDGPAEHTRAFWNLHEQYLDLDRDSSIFHKQLHDRMNRLLNDDEKFSANVLAETELALTQHFFEFADYTYTGKFNPEELQWHIPKMKIDAVKLLDSLTKTKGENLQNWEPVNEQYQKLKNSLAQLYKIEKSGAWQRLDLGKNKVLRANDSATAVIAIKKNLALTGDYSNGDETALFNSEMEDAVKNFQRRHGLDEDGVIGPAFVKAMNVPVSRRIEQVLMNMERMRWLPQDSSRKRVIVNIPEFRLHVYDGDHEVLNMAIIVGKEATRTIIFSGSIRYVVFAPYWNVPPSIVRKEILPAMRRNSNYLSNNNMEITKYEGGLPVIRQRPGIDNALGRVKFLFPNSYNIYLHDTPARSLFQSTTRAFSHGCIRIQKPEEMANFLLGDEGCTPEQVHEAMNGTEEQTITLKKKVPVYIVYFTAWVDENGLLNFRDDIYGHDKVLASHMFQSK